MVGLCVSHTAANANHQYSESEFAAPSKQRRRRLVWLRFIGSASIASANAHSKHRSKLHVVECSLAVQLVAAHGTVANRVHATRRIHIIADPFDWQRNESQHYQWPHPATSTEHNFFAEFGIRCAKKLSQHAEAESSEEMIVTLWSGDRWAHIGLKRATHRIWSL